MIKVDKKAIINQLKKKKLEKKIFQEVYDKVMYPSQEDVLTEYENLTKNVRR
jgi:hypothetical protein